MTEYNECYDCSFSGKEYAKQMRENAVIDKNGNVIVSEELWQQIANIIETQQTEIEICSEVIERQDKKIEELNKFANKRLDKFTEQYDRILKAEAIKDFADRFDDVLAGMRDEYAHFGSPEYGLVCEVVHHKLLKTMREMVGIEK